MNRILKSALWTIVLAGGVVAGCSNAEDHSGHDHTDGDGHDNATDKAK